MNEQAKRYTIKQLTESLNTVDNVVRKKVKRYKFPTTQEVINGRLTTTVKLTDSELNELIEEIEFNKTTYKVENNQSLNTNHSVNEQLYNTDVVGVKPESSDILVSGSQQTTNQLLSLIAQYAEKAGKYELLEDKSKEEKENVKFWQDKYFEKENEIKELIKQVEQLKSENKALNDHLKKENEQQKSKSLFNWIKNK